MLSSFHMEPYQSDEIKPFLGNNCGAWSLNFEHHSKDASSSVDIYIYSSLNCSVGIFCRYNHWARASPWLTGSNPRDNIMPIDGDNGFFPTTGNELVSFSLSLVPL